MKPPTFRTAYGPKLKVTFVTSGISHVIQSAKAECDINQIMAKYQKTGSLAHANEYEPQYGEVSSIDLHSALNTVKTAESMFNDLPSSIRSKFLNQPGLFLDFVQNPDNLKEMAELGLIAKQSPTPDQATAPGKTEAEKPKIATASEGAKEEEPSSPPPST